MLCLVYFTNIYLAPPSEQVGVAVMLRTCIWKVANSNLSWDSGLLWFSAAFQARYPEMAMTASFQVLFISRFISLPTTITV